MRYNCDREWWEHASGSMESGGTLLGWHTKLVATTASVPEGMITTSPGRRTYGLGNCRKMTGLTARVFP